MWSGTVQRQSAAAEYKRRFELQFSGTEQRQSEATQCKCTVQRHSDTVQHFRGPVQQHRAEVAKKMRDFSVLEKNQLVWWTFFSTFFGRVSFNLKNWTFFSTFSVHVLFCTFFRTFFGTLFRTFKSILLFCALLKVLFLALFIGFYYYWHF